MKISTATVIILFLLVVGMQTASAAVNMRFVSISDLHFNDTGNPADDAVEMTNITNALNNESNSSLGLNFIFFNGDIIDNRKNTTNFTSDAYLINSTYFSKLTTKFYAIQGNHDIRDDYNTSAVEVNESQWQAEWGTPSEYSFVSGNYLFIFLNVTSPAFGTNHPNITFLQNTLDSNPSKEAFIFLHIPQTNFSSLYTIDNVPFQQVIANHSNVVTVINGHLHLNDTCDYENLASRCNDGHAGQNFEENSGLPYQGYRVFEASDDGSVLTYQYDLNNNTFVNMDMIKPPSSSPQCGVNTTGLVACYTFDGDTGIYANDSSGNNLNGTWQGNNTNNYTNGRYNHGGNFTGNSNATYVDIPTNNILNFGTSNFTLEFWGNYIGNNPSNMTYISKRNATIGSVGWVMRDGVFALFSSAGQFAVVNVSDLATTEDSGTHFYSFVVNQVSSPYIKRYKDGVFNNAGYAETPVNLGSVNSASDVWIGFNNAGGTIRYFDGMIDSVRIYNRTKSSDEIFNDYLYDNTQNQISSSSNIRFGRRLNNTIYPNGTVVYPSRNANTLVDSVINITIVPSSDSVTFLPTLWNTVGNFSKIWVEGSTNHSVTTQHTIGDFPANTAIYLLIDGVASANNVIISNNTGFITFTYSGGFSDHTFQLTTTVQDTTHSSILTSCNSAISWATIGFAMIVIVLLAAGGGMALMMLMNKTFDGGLLIRYVAAIVVIVIIGTVGLSIANPIVNLLGC